MHNHNLHLKTEITGEIPSSTVPSPRPERPEWFAPDRFLAPLNWAIASLHHRAHQGGTQVIIRFKNGYGAIISKYRLLAGIYEIAPLRFHGPGRDDHEFYFRSHVPDLTWCLDRDEMVKVGEQISRLLPPRTV